MIKQKTYEAVDALLTDITDNGDGTVLSFHIDEFFNRFDMTETAEARNDVVEMLETIVYSRTAAEMFLDDPQRAAATYCDTPRTDGAFYDSELRYYRNDAEDTYVELCQYAKDYGNG